jgi:hypothetical protein
MVRAIQITMGLQVLVDDDDFDELNQFSWCAKVCKSGKIYAQRNAKHLDGKWKPILMHRYLLQLGPKDGVEVDHIDGDGLNNTRSNMRRATHRKNLSNLVARQGCSSKFKGVSWHKASQKWTAYVGAGGHKGHKYLGLFLNETDAARAYDLAAKKMFGQFAKFNFEDLA